jgi:hypothetical protein
VLCAVFSIHPTPPSTHTGSHSNRGISDAQDGAGFSLPLHHDSFRKTTRLGFLALRENTFLKGPFLTHLRDEGPSLWHEEHNENSR